MKLVKQSEWKLKINLNSVLAYDTMASMIQRYTTTMIQHIVRVSMMFNEYQHILNNFFVKLP